jgi:hypothetical protein
MMGEHPMKRPNDLTMKLKPCDSEVQNYVVALETKNAKLQKEIAKLEVENVSYQHKITALEKMRPQAQLIIKNLYEKAEKEKTNGT